MKPFNIFYQTEEQYNDICDQLHRFGYNTQGLQTFNGDIRQCFFLIMDHDFIRIQRGSVIIDSHIFSWSTQRKEAIKFMEDNSDSIKLSNELNERHDAECMRNMFGNESKTSQLEQRIRELEIKQITDLDDVNKRMRAIDKKLRKRVNAVEYVVLNHTEELRKDAVKIDKMDKWIAAKIKLDKSIKDYEREEAKKFGGLVGGIQSLKGDHSSVTSKGDDIVVAFDRDKKMLVNTVGMMANLPNKEKEPKPKIAIRVENEEEFNELMKIMGCRGWKWISGLESTEQPYPGESEEKRKVLVSFNRRFTWSYENEYYPIHEIIPFQTLKAILG